MTKAPLEALPKFDTAVLKIDAKATPAIERILSQHAFFILR